MCQVLINILFVFMFVSYIIKIINKKFNLNLNSKHVIKDSYFTMTPKISCIQAIYYDSTIIGNFSSVLNVYCTVTFNNGKKNTKSTMILPGKLISFENKKSIHSLHLLDMTYGSVILSKIPCI